MATTIATLALPMMRGDDFAHVFYIVGSDEVTPVNITGRTYAMQMRSDPDATAVALTLTCTVPTGTDGAVNVAASHTLTAALVPGLYVGDLQETASGVPTTLVQVQFTVSADVTR